MSLKSLKSLKSLIVVVEIYNKGISVAGEADRLKAIIEHQLTRNSVFQDVVVEVLIYDGWLGSQNEVLISVKVDGNRAYLPEAYVRGCLKDCVLTVNNVT